MCCATDISSFLLSFGISRLFVFWHRLVCDEMFVVQGTCVSGIGGEDCAAGVRALFGGVVGVRLSSTIRQSCVVVYHFSMFWLDASCAGGEADRFTSGSRGGPCLFWRAGRCLSVASRGGRLVVLGVWRPSVSAPMRIDLVEGRNNKKTKQRWSSPSWSWHDRWSVICCNWNDPSAVPLPARGGWMKGSGRCPAGYQEGRG